MEDGRPARPGMLRTIQGKIFNRKAAKEPTKTAKENPDLNARSNTRNWTAVINVVYDAISNFQHSVVRLTNSVFDRPSSVFEFAGKCGGHLPLRKTNDAG
jgi:hypothetical protein